MICQYIFIDYVTNVPTIVMLIFKVGEVVQVWGQEYMEFFLLSVQFCCEHKAVLRNEV